MGLNAYAALTRKSFVSLSSSIRAGESAVCHGWQTDDHGKAESFFVFRVCKEHF